MTLSDSEIGSIVTVVVVLLTALANYLNHLSSVQAQKDTQQQVARISEAVNGQAVHLQVVTNQLQSQADSAKTASVVAASVAATRADTAIVSPMPPPGATP